MIKRRWDEQARMLVCLNENLADEQNRFNEQKIILNSAVGAVAKTANALKIGIIFTDLQRNRTHPYGELEIRKNNS